MSRIFLYFLAITWALVTVPAIAVIERRIERQFDVPMDAVLKVDTFDGAVRITEVAEGKTIDVVVVQTAEVDTEAAMDALLASLELSMDQRNGAVTLTARQRKRVGWSWHTWAPVSLVYEIKVPRRCDVQVDTLTGGIVIGSLEGSVVLNSESGDIFTGEINGPVTARSHTGRVAITAASGPIIASTLTGALTVGRATDHTRLSSRGGYIELQQASGEVVVRGSGSDAGVGFVSPVRHPADIMLSGGDLSLVLETNSACTLNLRSSLFGKVAVADELPLKVVGDGDRRSRLKATLNGGGPVIVARASGGNVILRGVEPFPSARTEQGNE